MYDMLCLYNSDKGLIVQTDDIRYGVAAWNIASDTRKPAGYF